MDGFPSIRLASTRHLPSSNLCTTGCHTRRTPLATSRAPCRSPTRSSPLSLLCGPPAVNTRLGSGDRRVPYAACKVSLRPSDRGLQPSSITALSSRLDTSQPIVENLKTPRTMDTADWLPRPSALRFATNCCICADVTLSKFLHVTKSAATLYSCQVSWYVR